MEKINEEEEEIIEELEKVFKQDIFDGKKLVGLMVTLKCKRCGNILMQYTVDYPSYKKHLLRASSCSHFDLLVVSETEFNLLIANKNVDKQEWEQFKKIYLIKSEKEIIINDKSFLFIPKDN